MGSVVSLKILSVFQSESARSVAMKLSSPKMLKNAFAAEIALVLDDPEADLILDQHIQDVL